MIYVNICGYKNIIAPIYKARANADFKLNIPHTQTM